MVKVFLHILLLKERLEEIREFEIGTEELKKWYDQNARERERDPMRKC